MGREAGAAPGVRAQWAEPGCLERVSATRVGLEHQFLVTLLWDMLQDFSGVMRYLSIRFNLAVCLCNAFPVFLLHYWFS